MSRVALVAAVVFATFAIGGQAGCPPDKVLIKDPNVTWYDEQCGWYAETQKETCCTNEQVWVDQLRVVAGDRFSKFDNNNKGCKPLSNECNEWMMFYLCGINCSPDFTNYLVVPSDTGAKQGYYVCESIIKLVKENCVDDEWPANWPVNTGNSQLCITFKDVDENYIASNIFKATIPSGDQKCYSSASWLRPTTFILPLLASLSLRLL